MNKTLIIVEGMDNTGKDSLIYGIKNMYKDSTIDEIHFTGPSSKNTQLAFIEQIQQFTNNLYKTLQLDSDIIIWNRSHVGEYVYGQIYRNIDSQNIKILLNLIDNILESSNLHIIYVQLICTSNNLIMNNEDGKSLSTLIEKNKYIETLNIERNLFKEAFNIVSNKFKKILINVNDNDSFIDKNSILNKVIEKINE